MLAWRGLEGGAQVGRRSGRAPSRTSAGGDPQVVELRTPSKRSVQLAQGRVAARPDVGEDRAHRGDRALATGVGSRQPSGRAAPVRPRRSRRLQHDGRR